MYFDAHSDILYDVTRRRLTGETDVLRTHHLDRLRAGQIEGSVFVLWVDPPHLHEARTHTDIIMTCAQDEFSECDEVRVVHTYEEMLQAKADGKFYIFLGIEGMAAVGEDLSLIDIYYAFGCRHAMLTWNDANSLGAGATSGIDSGLTPLGKQAVRRIQDKGMLLDVSHLNEAGFWDVVSLASRPIIASHSNASALCGVPRNLTDDQLRAIRDLGGVIGLNAFNQFIHHAPARQTAAQLARHADHLINLMGIDHVGCGFDFCEFIASESLHTKPGSVPFTQGLETCAQVPNFFRCLKELGLSEDELEKIAFRNFHRVIQEVVG